MVMAGDEDLKRLLKAACPPVATPPQFKRQLLDHLMREVTRQRPKKKNREKTKRELRTQ